MTILDRPEQPSAPTNIEWSVLVVPGLFGRAAACYSNTYQDSGGPAITLEGTVVNGAIVVDGGVQLPEGARVRIEVAEPDDLAPPPEPHDREKELAILRESLEDVRAGRVMPFEDFMAQLAEGYQLPPVPPE